MLTDEKKNRTRVYGKRNLHVYFYWMSTDNTTKKILQVGGKKNIVLQGVDGHIFWNSPNLMQKYFYPNTPQKVKTWLRLSVCHYSLDAWVIPYLLSMLNLNLLYATYAAIKQSTMVAKRDI